MAHYEIRPAYTVSNLDGTDTEVESFASLSEALGMHDATSSEHYVVSPVFYGVYERVGPELRSLGDFGTEAEAEVFVRKSVNDRLGCNLRGRLEEVERLAGLGRDGDARRELLVLLRFFPRVTAEGSNASIQR